MDRTISATVTAAPKETMAALSDLGTYPEWLSLVTAATAEDGAGSATWLVTLRARLGPLARSKRLRMERVELTDTLVRFTRAETDGRDHAEWTLDASLDARPDNTCDVRVHLHYGGALWSTPLEIVLASFEGSAAERLSAYLSTDEGAGR